MITKLKHHNRCDVQIVFSKHSQHHAQLECCDAQCKRKSKWIQWLGVQDTQQLRRLGIPVRIDQESST